MNRTICFGELMIRLNPPGFDRIVQTPVLEFNFGGTEANVAVALASLGQDAAFVSVMPDNPIAQAAINSLRRYGVDTGGVLRGGERIGIYYVERGASQRNSRVIYDRKHSAVAEADPTVYDWEKLFEGADHFHFTGITAALSEKAASACMDACRAAKKAGIKVSCDLNYRSALWSEQKAGEVMRGYLPYIDLLIANEEHADHLLGVRSDDKRENELGMLCDEACADISKKLSDEYGCKSVALTLRKTISADDNIVGGTLYDREEGFASGRPFKLHIVDRVGGGDAFDAGLLYAELHGLPLSERIDLAVAASAFKHTVPGDYCLMTEAELLAMGRGKADGRIQR